jgi:hypothetical protein
MSVLRFFGDILVLPHYQRVPVPLGLLCLACERHFKRDDAGLIMPWETHDNGTADCAYHYRCFTRNIGIEPENA